MTYRAVKLRAYDELLKRALVREDDVSNFEIEDFEQDRKRERHVGVRLPSDSSSQTSAIGNAVVKLAGRCPAPPVMPAFPET
jgi:hypothetical protein